MLVDCHCHLLPDLDDGAQSLDEALALARQEVTSGVTHAVVTPHGSSRNLQQTLQLREGDKVVMTGGITDGTSGNTNLIKVETI